MIQKVAVIKIANSQKCVILVCLFVCSIYPPDSWENVRRLSVGQLLPRPTFEDTSSILSACYFVLSPVFMFVFFY